MKRQEKSLEIKKLLIILMLSLFTILVMIHIGFSIYFKDRFVFGTYINGINFSGKTVEEVEDSITSKVRNYMLIIHEKDGIKERITANDIDMQTELDTNLEELKEKQNSFHWIGGLFQKKNHNITTLVSYDSELLRKAFDNLECLDEEKVVKPQDAYISEYMEDEGYQIIEATYGNQVKIDKFYTEVVSAVDKLQTDLSIEEVNCYETPKYTADSKELKEALKTMTQYSNTNITYEFGNRKETVDASIISEWLELNDKFEVVFNTDNVRKYVDYLGYTYNTFGATRTFDTSYKKTIKIKGGDYGWWLNRAKEVEELIEVVKKGENITKVPNYYQRAGSYGANDIGNTYVEINLKMQHLFFYKNGELIVESDFVSGNLAKGFGTPIGTYSITYKEHDATLVGEDYSTPVRYWMPFNNNIGLHDASWRSTFGGELYLRQGSHGCINLPPKVAKVIFENIEKGTAVIVYKLDVKDPSENEEDGIELDENDTNIDTADTVNQNDSNNGTESDDETESNDDANSRDN